MQWTFGAGRGGETMGKIVWTALKYGSISACGVILFRLTTLYAAAERGYQAVGGEAVFLLLPVLYWVGEAIVRDLFQNLVDKQ